MAASDDELRDLCKGVLRDIDNRGLSDSRGLFVEENEYVDSEEVLDVGELRMIAKALLQWISRSS